jgi:hypothetical protein
VVRLPSGTHYIAGHRSLFGRDGVVPGTQRVGRLHFDDADLVERRFELDLGAAR